MAKLACYRKHMCMCAATAGYGVCRDKQEMEKPACYRKHMYMIRTTTCYIVCQNEQETAKPACYRKHMSLIRTSYLLHCVPERARNGKTCLLPQAYVLDGEHNVEVGKKADLPPKLSHLHFEFNFWPDEDDMLIG